MVVSGYDPVCDLRTNVLSSSYAPTSKSSSSPTAIVVARVVTGEATKIGSARDDGETGKEPDNHSARIAEAAALSPSSFRKRYISSYETPSLSSSLTLPIRK
nr:hypothetical protein [Tanacetum cinerariifolium]